MPGLSEPDLQDALARTDCSILIILVTGHGSLPMGITAMKKGAVDFLPKPFDPGQLLEAPEKHREIRRIEAERTDVHEKPKLLTHREEEIFRCVVSGMLNKQIAYKLGITEKTVKIRRGHITEKLGISSVVELVRLAQKGGVKSPTPGNGGHP